jgi:hypothetical protein
VPFKPPSKRLGLALALAALLCLACGLALAVTGHEPERSFGPDGTEGTQFSFAGAVAVDEVTHNVYVIERSGGLGQQTVNKFDGEGVPVNFTAGAGSGTNDIGGFSLDVSERGATQVAVNPTTHDFYVADTGHAVIKAFHANGAEAQFSEGPGEETNELPALTTRVCGVAVDANGAIYMGDPGVGVRVFAPSGQELTSFPVEDVCNLAVDSDGTVYLAHSTNGLGTVERFTPSDFPVTGATTYPAVGDLVDEGPAFAITVDSTSDELYVVKHPVAKSRIVQYDQTGQVTTEFGETGPGALTDSEGIAVDGSTGKVYASDAAGDERVEIFAEAPPLAPSVESSSAANITSTSANLRAEVNPNFYFTHYHFEYLSEAQYEANGNNFSGAQVTPEAVLGAAGEPQIAQAHIGGLSPNTAYRFRVVAENENGEDTSAAPAPGFATYPTASAGLPDGRAYEMVSPQQKAGEVFAPFQAGFSCAGCVPGEGVEMMAVQSAADGNAVAYEGQPFFAGLSPLADEYLSGRSAGGWGSQSLSSAAANGYYLGFSDDLGTGVILQQEPALSAQAPTQGGKAFQNLYLRSAAGLFQPLVTVEPPQRSLAEFRAVYGGANAGTGGVPGFSHVIFEANDALTGDVDTAPAAPLVAPKILCVQGKNCNLYEWAEGELRLVNVLPGNEEAASGAVLGAGYRLAPSAFAADFEARAVEHAISDDGSRIFWSEEASGQLYLRIEGQETREVKDPGTFLVASADGSRVLLDDGCLYDVEGKECEAELAGGQAAKFKGTLGAAEDLSRIYFVSTAVLSGANPEGEAPVPGGFNLYGWEAGETSFISTLLATDNEFTNVNYGDWHAAASNRTAQVSGDGRYLAFISRAPLSGYDNRLAGGGNCKPSNTPTPACFEVFEYDLGEKELVCASCNPSGQRPLGASRLSLIRVEAGNNPFRQLGNLSAEGEGRLFFESEDALTPQDTNGVVQDVYQWEPEGVGSCERAGGCVSLISSGRSPFVSLFLDSTPSGGDAFFITRDQILPIDQNEQIDVYDARVPHVLGENVGFPEAGIAPCEGAACSGPVSPSPPPAGAGSAEFAGPGNPPTPKKQKKKKHKKHRKSHNRGGSK